MSWKQERQRTHLVNLHGKNESCVQPPATLLLPCPACSVSPCPCLQVPSAHSQGAESSGPPQGEPPCKERDRVQHGLGQRHPGQSGGGPYLHLPAGHRSVPGKRNQTCLPRNLAKTVRCCQITFRISLLYCVVWVSSFLAFHICPTALLKLTLSIWLQ